MPILDTRTNKDLIGTIISDIVLQLLSYVAQAEREFNHQRQAEGIAIARANGKHLGRPRKPYPADFDACLKSWQDGQITFEKMAERLRLTEGELRWLVRRRNKE